MRRDVPSPVRPPPIRRLAGLGVALSLACAGTLHAQPTRSRVVDLEGVVATATGRPSSPADWKVPSAAYARERKEMLAELRRARELWARRGPAAYAFRLHPGCLYMPYCPAPGWKVAVPADPPRAGGREAAWRSVEGLFALLESALRSDHYRVSHVRYHPRLGYPLRWTQDAALPIGHGHSVFRVHDFRALSPGAPRGLDDKDGERRR